jgi:L-ascorbate metabolism protein UlaG (beta-lactamase superfamily)
MATAAITWWGSAAVELQAGGRRLVVDPYLHPADEAVDYILLTREDHDHCHEPTIERLAGGPAFKGLLAPKSCTVASTLDSPVLDGHRDLAFIDPALLTVMWPKYRRKPGARSGEPTEVALDGFHVEAVDSSEHEPVTIVGSEFLGKRYRPDSGELWPARTGSYAGLGALPNLGYVITDTENEVSVYHPGGLQEAFDSQRELRGRIDYMLLPLATLAGAELSAIDNVRPRHVIPIGYRTDDPDFPIPLEIAAESITSTDLNTGRPRPWADQSAYRREIHAMMRAHWYRSPAAPLERMETLKASVAELGAEVVVLTAGQPHEIAAGAERVGAP